MSRVSDNFQRPNGVLGGSWGPVNSVNAEGTGVQPTGGNIVINGNAYGPDNPLCGDAYSIFPGTFGSAQYSAAQIATIAPFTSVVNITAAVNNGNGTTTYTYTLTSGNPLIIPQAVYISGMANAGNNGNFLTSALGAGTFTVTNANGVNAAGQSGTGISPSDSNCGLCVFGSADGKNAYFFVAGTNSFVQGGQVYTRELWKFVNGVGIDFNVPAPLGTFTTIPDVPGDTYSIVRISNRLIVSKNNTILTSKTDSDLSSGSPGLWIWSMNGPKEFSPPWGLLTPQPPGNGGTTWTNWQGGDSAFSASPILSDTFLEGPTFSQVASDSFQRANGPVGSNWTSNLNGFNISGNTCVGNTAAVFNGMFWSADSFNDAHYSTITIGSGTGQWGPSVRAQAGADSYYSYSVSGVSPNMSGSFFKRVAGVNTNIGGTVAGFATGDTVTLACAGNVLFAFRNGTFVAAVKDSTFSGGKPGIQLFSTTNAITSWSGGNFSPVPSNFSTLVNQAYVSDKTSGGFAPIVDSNSDAVLYENSVVWPPDQYAECVMTGVSAPSGGGVQVGPAVRIDPATDSGYMLSPDNVGRVVLWRTVNAVNVIMDLAPHVYSAGDVFRIEVQGSFIVGKVNGVILVAGFDNTLATGRPGFRTRLPGSPTVSSFKNWVGGSISNSVYSVPDCRNFGNFPNNSINVNQTLIYTAQKFESRTAGAPVDSRTTIPVPSGTYPQNSRTPGTFGPGE